MSKNLRELLEAATPGEWSDASGYEPDGEWLNGFYIPSYQSGHAQWWNLLDSDRPDADAALIVALRNKAELLLDVVEAAVAWAAEPPVAENDARLVKAVRALKALDQLESAEGKEL